MHVIQEEPLEMIDAETRGLLASIGIEKGKAFNPDERMKRILNRCGCHSKCHGAIDTFGTQG